MTDHSDAIGAEERAYVERERREQYEVTDTNPTEGERSEQELAEAAYPDHHPVTALANYRAGRQVWDTNGDIW